MKKAIMVISIIAIIIILVLFCMIFMQNKTNTPKEETNTVTEEPQSSTNIKLNISTVNSEYYQAKRVISEFISNIKNKEYNKVYYKLPTQYILENNITLSNITQIINNYDISENFNVVEIYKEEIDEEITNYFIQVITEKKNNVYYIFTQKQEGGKGDNGVRTISGINQCTKQEYDKYINGQLKYEQNIQANDYNSFAINAFSDEIYATDFFYEYINEISSNLTYSFELLDENYKKIKFPQLNLYEQYINSKLEDFRINAIKSCEVTKVNGYSQAVIETYKAKKYIININKEYRYIILDDYTILSQKELQEYNKMTNEEKVTKNVERFVDMLNDKDYIQAYSKLADSFKQNSFKTQADFENFINQNLYENKDNVQMVLDKQEVEQNGDVYVSQAVLTHFAASIMDAVTNKNVTVIMQLGTNADFSMSFNINGEN